MCFGGLETKGGRQIVVDQEAMEGPEDLCFRLQARPASRQSSHFECLSLPRWARVEQAETTRLYEQKKCQEAADDETIYSEAIKDTLEKTGMLEKHAKTATTNEGGILGDHGSTFL